MMERPRTASPWTPLLVLACFVTPAHGQQSIELIPHAERSINGATVLTFAPGGEFVLVGTRGGAVHELDLDRLETLRSFDAGRGRVNALAVSPAGDQLFVATHRRDLFAFDLVSGERTGSVRVDATPTSLDVSGNGRFLAVGHSDGSVVVYTDRLMRVRNHEAPDFYRRDVAFVAWGQGGEELFGATSHGASAYWRGGAQAPVRSALVNRREFVGASRDFSGDMLALGVKAMDLVRTRGQMVVEASYSIQVVDWANGRQIAELQTGERELRTVAVAPIRTSIAALHANGELSLWDVQRGTPTLTVQAPSNAVAMAFSTDGNWLAVTGGSGEVSLWSAEGLSGTRPLARVDAERILGQQKFEITTESTPLYRGGEELRLAVLGLTNLGIDSVLARSTDNFLNSRIAGYPNITLLEKDALDRVMEELRFQHSGLTSDADAARIGEMLNANSVIVGSVNQLGSSWVLSVRVVGVESRRVEGAREVRCNDCQPDDLPDAVRVLVETLFTRDP